MTTDTGARPAYLLDLPEQAILYQDALVLAVDKPPGVPCQTPDASQPDDLVSLKELERQHILEVLRAVGGNKALTSRHLGLDRKTLYRKLKEYALTRGEPAPTPDPSES